MTSKKRNQLPNLESAVEGWESRTISTKVGEAPDGGAAVIGCYVTTQAGKTYKFTNEKVGDPGDRMVSFIEENCTTGEFQDATYRIIVNAEGTIDETEYTGTFALDAVWDSISNLPYADENKADVPMPGFISSMDWEMLKSQKSDVLRVISLLEEEGGLLSFQEDIDSDESANSLNGIVHLIDAVQDYAADDLGIAGVFAEGDEARKLEGIDWIKVQAGIEELESDLGEHKSNGWEYENLEYTVKLLKRLVDRNDRLTF